MTLPTKTNKQNKKKLLRKHLSQGQKLMAVGRCIIAFIQHKTASFLISLVKVLMRQTFGTEETFSNMPMIAKSFCDFKLKPVGTNMQWLLNLFNYPPPLLLHSSHYSLHILEYNVPKELSQLPLRFLLPRLHKNAITFRGRWVPPSEVTHPIRPVFSVLWAQHYVCFGADPCPWQPLVLMALLIQLPLCFILVTAQLPASPETALGGAPSFQRRGEDFDGPTFTARGFPPAEMLHWIGASLVAVGFQIWLWYLVSRGGQGGQMMINDAE